MTKGTVLAKSFNRSTDVLPNAPLRGKEWLLSFAEADDDGKEVLGKTWLARLFQHTKGMKQLEYDSFMQKLYLKQIDWLVELTKVIDASFFEAEDITPHAHNIYDLLWNPHTNDIEVLGLRDLWFKNDASAILTCFAENAPSAMSCLVKYGSLVLTLLDRPSISKHNSLDTQEIIADISCSIGESGVKPEDSLNTQSANWQRFGYYSIAAKEIEIESLDQSSIAEIIATVTGSHTKLLLKLLPRYIAHASYKADDGYEYVKRKSILAQLGQLDTDVTPQYVLLTWLRKYQGILCSILFTPLAIDETCNKLCTRI